MSEETRIVDPVSLSIYKSNRRKRPCLVVYNGPDVGKTFHITKENMTIGRNRTEDIIIVDSSVSRQHARVTMVDDDTIKVEDLGSSNGTFVDHVRLTSATTIKEGGLVQLGNIVLKFFSSSSLDAISIDKIYKAAVIDPGTNIFNRKYLMDALANEFKYSKDTSRPLSIIYYDLDFFKKVNDTYGHNAGDAILHDCSQLVKSTIRKEDILGRYGGEEFVIILPDAPLKTAHELAERVRSRIENNSFELEITQNGLRKKVLYKQTFSLGVSELDGAMQKPEDLLESADKKLYTSKHSGRNRVTV